MQAIPMTLRGAEKLREELDYLKSVRRPEIIAAIADAREHGDLKQVQRDSAREPRAAERRGEIARQGGVLQKDIGDGNRDQHA